MGLASTEVLGLTLCRWLRFGGSSAVICIEQPIAAGQSELRRLGWVYLGVYLKNVAIRIPKEQCAMAKGLIRRSFEPFDTPGCESLCTQYDLVGCNPEGEL